MENTILKPGDEGYVELTKSDLAKSFWLWNSLAQSTYSFERMMAPGFASSMIPVMKRLYPKELDKQIEMAKRHMEFYNTEVWMVGGLVVGLVASMEESKANGLPLEGSDISSVKTSLMGPLAGIGDTLRQGTLIPIIGSIAISLGMSGNLIAPVLYMVLTLVINYSIGWILFKLGYNKGKEGIAELFASGLLEKYMTLATTVGAITVGGLAATTVKASSSLTFTLGENQLVVQELLDKILVNLLPFGIIMFTYWLLQKKKVSSTKILLILIVVAVVGVLIGVL